MQKLLFLILTISLSFNANAKNSFLVSKTSKNQAIVKLTDIFKSKTGKFTDFWDDAAYGSIKTFSYVSENEVITHEFLYDLINYARGKRTTGSREISFDFVDRDENSIGNYFKNYVFEFADSPTVTSLTRSLSVLAVNSISENTILSGSDFNIRGKCNWLLIVDSKSREATLINGCTDFGEDFD